MAKKRKVGGVHVQGLFRIKAYHETNEEAYLKRIYEMNKSLFESAYK